MAEHKIEATQEDKAIVEHVERHSRDGRDLAYCDRCGVGIRVRPTQAQRLELWDCPVCGHRNMSSISAAAESHSLNPKDEAVRARFAALGHVE